MRVATVSLEVANSASRIPMRDSAAARSAARSSPWLRSMSAQAPSPITASTSAAATAAGDRIERLNTEVRDLGRMLTEIVNDTAPSLVARRWCSRRCASGSSVGRGSTSTPRYLVPSHRRSWPALVHDDGAVRVSDRIELVDSAAPPTVASKERQWLCGLKAAETSTAVSKM